jgi:hypothetical protein
MQKMFLAMMERMEKAEARHIESLAQMDARHGERMERMAAHLSSASSGPPASGPSLFSSSPASGGGFGAIARPPASGDAERHEIAEREKGIMKIFGKDPPVFTNLAADSTYFSNALTKCVGLMVWRRNSSPLMNNRPSVPMFGAPTTLVWSPL